MTFDLQIYTGNRLEQLVKQLARIVRQPLPLLSPISPEMIVVQSKGMERWVSMELAHHNGICANCLFPFPNTFLQGLFGNIIPDLPEQPLYEPTALTFKIMKILPDCLQHPGFESLGSYLEKDDDPLKLFQISEKIAGVFDQYLVFRPDMILAWEQGRESHWQARLWRMLADSEAPCHRARLQHILIDKIKTDSDIVKHLPARLSIFGIAYLPPFYLQVFAEISRRIPVNLFLMNPCKEYWADIVSEKEINKIRKKYRHAADEHGPQYLEEGNRLLASMGVLGRDFFSMISALDCQTHEMFEAAAEIDMLSAVQNDILYLKNRKMSGELQAKPDGSIQIHSCHSPMREIEVLHDHLLAAFEQDPELLPKDIVVMIPDIESYSSYIQAVFESQVDEHLRVPFSIADQTLRRASRIIDAFLSILKLPNSRLSVPQVMAFLEISSVKQKFDLNESDIEQIEHWVRETNIRWGIDARSRSELNLPAYAENTWRAGIERLLLGYALPGKNCRMFSDILPYDHIEGHEVNILGKFLEFLDQLFKAVKTLRRKQSLTEWHSTLGNIFEQFFAVDEALEREARVLRQVLDNLVRNQELSGFDQPVAIEIVRSYLEKMLEHDHFGTGFIARGVTFCAMLPMRSIPFKMICLVGLNNDNFPRESTALSFDLMAQKARIGDRSRRNDDKYLFLEALLSARKRLFISYTGQSIQDNTLIPPSVLVSELLDYIQEGFGVLPGQVTTRHKLQAFSPEYFVENSGLFSYSHENFAAVAGMQKPNPPQPWPAQTLTEPNLEWKHLDIETLCAFFRNPARFLLEKRFGIYLTQTRAIPEESEIFSLDNLEKYLIGQDLVKSGLSASDHVDDIMVHRAQGMLPHGNIGERVYSEMHAEAQTFVRTIEPHIQGIRQKPLKADLDIAGFHLAGSVNDIYENGLIQTQYAIMKPKYILNTWIYHIVLNVMLNDNASTNSLLFCKNAVMEYKRVAKATAVLEDLLSLYWQGMSNPLHFFPISSFEYAQRRLIKNHDLTTALGAARKKWLGSDYSSGEVDDPYYGLCFKNMDPIDEEFQNIAEKVFAPLLAHCTKTNL